MLPSSAQSALDLLILTVLQRRGPLHGYGIATAINTLSENALSVQEGSLYPALHRMEEAGWIEAGWETTENKRRARVYRMAAAGSGRLALETERWLGYSEGVSRVLRLA